MPKNLSQPLLDALGQTEADPGTVRVGSMRAVSALLREHGFVPADVLASVGLDSRILDDPENAMSFATAGTLLQRCADLTGCRHFGLLSGSQTGVSAMGTLGELVQRSPTVGVALRSAVLYLQTRGGTLTCSVEGDNAILGYAIYQRDMPGALQVYNLAIALAFNTLQGLCGSHWVPREVSFSHAVPQQLGPYRDFFGPSLRFNGERSAIVFSKAWLEQVPPRADADVHRVLQRAAAEQELLRPDDWGEQVRRALRTMSPSGRASETQVSKALCIPARTLRRLLAVQGTSFRAQVEDVRYEFTRQLLTDTNLTTTEIAEMTGYADASAFTRAFRRWTGLPPAAWREKMRSAGDL